MGKAEQIAAKAEELLTPVTESFNVSVYDVEYVTENGEKYLRAYIDKEGGVTIDDCENVSRAFETKLDESGLIEDDRHILQKFLLLRLEIPLIQIIESMELLERDILQVRAYSTVESDA